MFNINENCRLDQFIAKKNFYTYADLTSGDKDLFKDNISKITLTYQLQPNKINILPFKDDIREYPLINFFDIAVEKDVKIKRIAEIVMKSIPYPTVITFLWEDKKQIWTAHQRTNLNDSSKNTLEEFVFTKWFDGSVEFVEWSLKWFDISKMNMTNFYTLYSNMVDNISVYNANSTLNIQNSTLLSGEEARRLTSDIQELDLKIAMLKSKIKKETQFNKRMEMNIEIKKLEQKKKEIVG